MRNLRAEMMRYGVTEKDIQGVLDCSANTVKNKIDEITDFTFIECLRIRNTFFEGYRLEYLFATETKTA